MHAANKHNDSLGMATLLYDQVHATKQIIVRARLLPFAAWSSTTSHN